MYENNACPGRNNMLWSLHSQIRRRVFTQDLDFNSHVTQYGDMKLSKEFLFTYMGTNPDNDNYTSMANSKPSGFSSASQYDAELLHFWYKVCYQIMNFFNWTFHMRMPPFLPFLVKNSMLWFYSSIELLKGPLGNWKLRRSCIGKFPIGCM